MKVATWNVNGIRARQAQVVDWIAEEAPDVICLQEIKAKPDQVPEPLCAISGYSCYWHGAGGYSGVGLHVKRDAFAAEPIFSHPEFDTETRIVEARIGRQVFASIYVPNGGKDYDAKIRFMRAMNDYARSLAAEGVEAVLCGDLNVARLEIDAHPKERKPGIIGQRPEEREIFEELLAYGFVDVARHLDPDNAELFTWWAPWRQMRERNIGWRIDYILASKALAARARSSYVRREFGTSDHGPLVAIFD